MGNIVMKKKRNKVILEKGKWYTVEGFGKLTIRPINVCIEQKSQAQTPEENAQKEALEKITDYKIAIKQYKAKG